MSGSVWYISVSKKKLEFKKYPSKKKNKKAVKKQTQKPINSAKKLLINLLFALSLIFLLNVVSAVSINDTFHINLQTTFSNGTIETGTFTFGFNITESSSSSCGAPIVYNHSTSKTTDTRGIVSLYLPTAGSGGGNLITGGIDQNIEIDLVDIDPARKRLNGNIHGLIAGLDRYGAGSHRCGTSRDGPGIRRTKLVKPHRIGAVEVGSYQR